MIDITRLNFTGELVGYRFSVGGKRYDVELDTVHRMGISLDGIEKSIDLKQVGNLLMSKVEREHGKLATDLSDDPHKLQRILEMLEGQPEKSNDHPLPTQAQN